MTDEFIIYQSGNQQARIQVRFSGGTLWLTQAQIAELFQTTPQNITLHIKAIYQEAELDEPSTCKDYLQVRQEGSRQKHQTTKSPDASTEADCRPRIRSPFLNYGVEKLQSQVRMKNAAVDSINCRALKFGWNG